MLANVHSIRQDHVGLTVSCIDRIYLNGYVPKLQTSGQLCYFLRDHLGYDLRRLRLKGVIHRIPGTTRYTVTTHGLHVALFCTKVYLRILRPAWAALLPDPDTIPRPLRDALVHLDAAIQNLCDAASLQRAA